MDKQPSHPARDPMAQRSAATQYPPVIDFPSTYSGQRAISISEIIKTGDVTVLPDLALIWRLLGTVMPSLGRKIDEYQQRQSAFNYTVDMNADDAFTRGLETIKQETIKEVLDSQVLQALLKKEGWVLSDRIKWEQDLGTITSKQMTKVLGEYRSEGISPVRRTGSLNELSSDIANSERKSEFDCEAMSIIKGMIMQMIDHQMLSSSYQALGSQKVPASYYYVTEPGHAYLVSPSTMSVIEGTSSAYYKNMNPWVDFQKFTEGEPIVILPPEDQNGEYGAYGMMEGLANFFEESDLARALKSAEHHTQELEKAVQSPQYWELAPEFGVVASLLRSAQEEWLIVFNRASGKPQRVTVIRDSFEHTFVNKFKNSDLSIDDGQGGFTTLGDAVTTWSRERLAELDKSIVTGAAGTRSPKLQNSQRIQFQPGSRSVARLFERSPSPARGDQGLRNANSTPASSAADVEAGHEAAAKTGYPRSRLR